MKQKTKCTSTNNETYKIERGLSTSGTPGRKSSRLGNTIRLLNIGDGFMYPFTSRASNFNVQRAAKTYGVELDTTKTGRGIFAVRTA